VSGGCLDADVCEVAQSVIRTGTPRLLHYDTGADDQVIWGLGLGCYGSVDVFVQPTDAPGAGDHFKTVRSLLAQGAPFAVCTIVDATADVGRSFAVTSEQLLRLSTGQPGLDGHLLRMASTCLATGGSIVDAVDGVRVFVEAFSPPPTLIVCGAGDDARPLVSYAADAGFAVVVVDHRRAFLSAERFPAARLLDRRPEDDLAPLRVDSGTAVVVMTHSMAHDREWLRRFLPTDAWYLGVLGPAARRAAILRQIGAEASSRVVGPVGLDLGAEGPEQIAISIVAELLAVQAGHQIAPLQRGAAAHA
jgi:xanthine dehydrogenase accessory factor